MTHKRKSNRKRWAAEMLGEIRQSRDAGKTLWIDETNGVDALGYGLSPEKPFKTWKYAMERVDDGGYYLVTNEAIDRLWQTGCVQL